MNLKQRLKDVNSMVKKPYSEVWDVACDHGNLGIALLKHPLISKVHFVDPVEKIIQILETKLSNKPRQKEFELHIAKGEDLILSRERNLIFICGVGGETAISILEGLSKNNDLAIHDFIICINHHGHQLREYLSLKDFFVQDEMLTFEAKKGYEILSVNKRLGKAIHPIGEDMYNTDNPNHQAYLKSLVSHYKRKLIGDETVRDILNLYNKIV